MSTRKHILAGSWYPSKTEEILKEMELYLKTDIKQPIKAIGIVAPHAGWRYSGAVAGYGYASVVIPQTVIVIAPNHRGVGNPKAIWSRGEWTIPDATIPVDEELSSLIIRHSGLVHDTFAHAHEHSLEIHLPFLYYRNPSISIVPICMMDMPLQVLKEIGTGMGRAIKEYSKEVLIVASSDMSHYLPAKIAKSQDDMAINKMLELDPEGLYETVRQNSISMCGVIPATVMLYAAKELGASSAKLLMYSHSGVVTGDDSEVVAYASIAVL